MATQTDPAHGPHISGSTTAVVVGYVRRKLGDAAVDELLRVAGEQRTVAELTDTSAWSSYNQAIALFEAAASLTASPDVGRDIGAELLRQHHGTEVAALLRSLGSPGELLRNVAATAAKYSTITSMEATEVGDDHGTVSARTAAGVARSRHFCLYTEGVLSQLSPLFGLPAADVRETRCQRHGDPECVYVVAWGADGDASDEERRLALIQAELASLTERFEALQSTSGALAAADDVETALALITNRAGLAVRAPQFVLAVRIDGMQDLQVHSIGVDPEDLDMLVREILEPSDGTDPESSRLIVDVGTAEHSFGKLAALYPPGAQFFAQERRLLESYAAHAAAALQTAAALETARRRDRTARALLDLAHGLSEEVSSEAVAERACEATMAIADVDQVAVWFFDAQHRKLTLAASIGVAADIEEALRNADITPQTSSRWELMVREPRPRWITRDIDDPFLVAMLDVVGVVTAVAVPITAHGEFHGVLVPGVTTDPTRLREDEDLVERLTGVARYSATALRNARLVEEVTRQALHDNLTGLPNGRLLHDRVDTAIEAARRDGRELGLLFLDLDRFKDVNDTLGHAAGDELLTGIAGRLTDAVRSADTVARLSGDEFIVLLPDIDGRQAAVVVADKILDALGDGFVIDGHHVTASASIGVAMYPRDGPTYQELLKHADAAMYEVKRDGRGRTQFR